MARTGFFPVERPLQSPQVALSEQPADHFIRDLPRTLVVEFADGARTARNPTAYQRIGKRHPLSRHQAKTQRRHPQ